MGIVTGLGLSTPSRHMVTNHVAVAVTVYVYVFSPFPLLTTNQLAASSALTQQLLWFVHKYVT